MRRFSFLSVFLSLLTVAFAVAVAFRIRSYSRVEKSELPATSVRTVTEPAPRIDFTPLAQSASPAAQQAAPATERRAALRARVREQLIREARAAPPPVAPPSVSRAKSAVARPQVKLPAPPAANSRPMAQPAHGATPVTPTSAGQASARPATAAAGPKDPNSDTTPPQLISIEFDPPQVHDGEEARVIMMATDDLSGIRGISGTITSPTGKALQGFAGQREADTNRYIGKVTIPKKGEEGLWRVNILTMSDNASNSVTLSFAQGTLPPNAVLRVVSSESDSTPPTLKSVRVDKRSMRVGEPNPIYIEAEDDQSGVNLVSAVFISPSKRARVGAGCRHTDGDLWQCDLSLPSCVDCGDWQLEQVTLQDKANNLATFRADNNALVQAVKINISGDSCDSEPPRLISLSLDQPVVNLGPQGGVVTVTIIATDDACGVAGVSGQFTGPGTGSGGFFPLQPSPDGNSFVGRIPLDPRAPRGIWRITSVQLTDKGHNLRIYYASDPLLANGTFQIR